MSSTALKTIKLVATGETIEVAPGKEIEIKVPAEAVPRYGLVKMMRQMDGRYLPVMRIINQHVRLTEETGKEMGMDLEGVTLRRLFRAGFIQGSRPAPNTIIIDLESVFEHFERCKDRDFWTRDRIDDFRNAI